MEKPTHWKKGKRCTKCGSLGPFYVHKVGEAYYWRSQCVPCFYAGSSAARTVRRKNNPTSRAKDREGEHRKRLERARLAIAHGRATRRLINFVARHEAPPGHIWCAWGQHYAKKGSFGVLRRAKSGRNWTCADCCAIKHRVLRAKQKVA